MKINVSKDPTNKRQNKLLITQKRSVLQDLTEKKQNNLTIRN